MKKEEYITTLVRELRLLMWKKGCKELCASPHFFPYSSLPQCYDSLPQTGTISATLKL